MVKLKATNTLSTAPAPAAVLEKSFADVRFLGGMMVGKLKDIPILGWLFSRRETIALMTETVAIVTPWVVDPAADRSTPRLQPHERELGKIRQELEQRYAEPDPDTPAAPTGN